MNKSLLAIPALCLGLGMLPAPLACAAPQDADGALPVVVVADGERATMEADAQDAELPIVELPPGTRLPLEPRVEDLSFLAGSWTGTDGTSRWESVYSSAEGGMVVGASKEMRGDRVVMIDFEHFYERDGQMRMTPFPFGNRSMEFTLTAFSIADRRAVFENPENDFPKRFTYEATAADHLRIELVGEMGGEAMSVVLELDRR
ncbi:MAG: DUF6265 family protein [Planctomycetota bacterium]|jgi:hypothetical protein